MDWMVAAAAGMVLYGRGLMWALPILTLAELLFSVQPQPLRLRLRPAVYWALSVPVTGGLMGLTSHLQGLLHLQPLISVELWFGWDAPTRALSLIAAPTAGAIIIDFFFYWMHRAQHRFFWRFHRVHHAIRDLNAVTSYHHISEELFHTALMVVPMSLLISPQVGPVIPLMAAVASLRGYYIHSNLRLHFGPVIRRVLCDNRFHRIHHSTDQRHFNANYCSVSPLWDTLFGTAYFPAKDEWPETGLAELPEPQDVREWLLAPLAPAGGPLNAPSATPVGEHA